MDVKETVVSSLCRGAFDQMIRVDNWKHHIHSFSLLLRRTGGPLYDKDNNALVGVTSWGVGCGMGMYISGTFVTSLVWNIN